MLLKTHFSFKLGSPGVLGSIGQVCPAPLLPDKNALFFCITIDFIGIYNFLQN